MKLSFNEFWKRYAGEFNDNGHAESAAYNAWVAASANYNDPTVDRLREYASEDWARLRQREAALITQVADLQNQLERRKPPLGYRHKTVCMFCDKQHGHYDECAEKFAELRNQQSA